MNSNLRRFGRTLTGASLLAGSLMAGLVTHAHASYGLCLDDPRVVLDNHIPLDLSTTIYTDASNVTEIDYAITLPAGTQYHHVNNTGALSRVTHITVSNTVGNSYSAVVTVHTSNTDGTTVSTTMTMGSETGTATGTNSVTVSL